MAADESCASCGVAAVDNVKLKKCACDLVKYCSVACQKNHRPQHKKMCKRRLAELRDVELFTMPEGSHLGECPICCLPLSIDRSKKTILTNCCSQFICYGCNHANQKRELGGGLVRRCVFCREPLPESKEENEKRVMKRVKKNCPAAMYRMGIKRGSEGDYGSALEYLTKAAALGNAEAHYQLSGMYRKGEGVEKDMEKVVYHLEQAAIGGHPKARHNCGCHEAMNGRLERAKKHWIIAANLGDHTSLEGLKMLYAEGHASKEDYAGALRAYQAAVNATKSAEREKAEAAIKDGELKLSF
jgi:TPR repeat protein